MYPYQFRLTAMAKTPNGQCDFTLNFTETSEVRLNRISFELASAVERIELLQASQVVYQRIWTRPSQGEYSFVAVVDSSTSDLKEVEAIFAACEKCRNGASVVRETKNWKRLK